MTPPNFTAKPQIVDDLEVSGLILTFHGVIGNLCRLSVEAIDLPHMNRDFYFAADGSFDGKGTFLGSAPDTEGTDRCECGQDTILGCGTRPRRHCGLWNAAPPQQGEGE